MIDVRAELMSLVLHLDEHNELFVATNVEPYLAISFVEDRDNLSGRAVFVEVGYDSLPFKLAGDADDHTNALSINTVNTLKDMLRNGLLTDKYLEQVRKEQNARIAESLGVTAAIQNVVDSISPSILQSINILQSMEKKQ